MRTRPMWRFLLLGGLVALVAIGMWHTGGRNAPPEVVIRRQVTGVMGTDATLAVVIRPADRTLGSDVLRDAERTIRDVEAELSTWIRRSELGGLNRATADQEVTLSPRARKLLRDARDAFHATDGAFDITCRPLIELWRSAGKDHRLPTEDELAAARAESNWEQIELTDRGARKTTDSARVDLGGIAKGYGIDRALAVLRRSKVAGGLVNAGGDLACFGHPPPGGPWEVDVQHPFSEGRFGTLLIDEGAICTSGNYRRFVEIDGQRYSHIIDPRSGLPAQRASAVTVMADDALTADIWATALSVLGPEGFDRMPEGVEALIIEGDAETYRVHATSGFWRHFRPLEQ